MSGRYITTAAATFPTRIKAAGSLYCVGIITDQAESPHLLLPEIQGELYYAFAEVDQHVPENIIPELKDALFKTKTLNMDFVSLKGLNMPRRLPRLLGHACLKCGSGR